LTLYERQKAWRLANPEKARASYAKWYSVNVERARREDREERSTPEGWKKQAIYSARKRAKHAGVPFDLRAEDLEVPSHCPVLGIPIVLGGGRNREDSPSLDRINPAKGYVKGNIAVVSSRANMLKNCGTAEEHARIASWMCSVGAT
jgi:hypothetical protein